MGDDGLTMQEARASAATVLTLFAMNKRSPTEYDLKKLSITKIKLRPGFTSNKSSLV